MFLKIILVLVLGIMFSLFVLYNHKVKKVFLALTDTLDKSVSKHVGLRIKKKHDILSANARIQQGGVYNKLTGFYDDILVHLGFKKSGVNVLSFVSFIFFASVTLTVITLFFVTDFFLSFVLVLVYFFFITVMFKFMALTKYEEIENMMMEAQDLIAMGIDAGVKNSIARYTPSLHPTIRPYFANFLNNIDREGYSFNEAMRKLNDDLGDSFNSFANACIEYENKGDNKTREVFSPLIDENEIKRAARETGNRAFAQIRMYFFASTAVTGAFAAYLILTEMEAQALLLDTTFGRIILVIDVVLVVFVLAFITTLKAQLLR